MSAQNETQLRDALAWATEDHEKAKDPSTNPFVWFWEAVEGDFNEDRSTKQILVDAGISMIPLVDQLCDIRDLIANCKKLIKEYKDTWAWVALALTLIGLFPTLGSLVKGVLKIFFGFIRRSPPAAAIKAVEPAMSWVISFLRRERVQRYLLNNKIDEVFKWLSDEIKVVKGKISVKALTDAFDGAIGVVEELVNKVSVIPMVGTKAKAVLLQVKEVRLMADKRLGEAIKPVVELVDAIILRLEHEALMSKHGIVDLKNVHFRGAIPEAEAVALMRKRKPEWLSKTGDEFIKPAIVKKYREIVDEASAKLDSAKNPRPTKDIFPYLSDQSIESFHALEAHSIKGPARLYRILSPNSRGMSDCWVTQEVFDRLRNAQKPKQAWRKFLAVWPDWNVNGQFVIYDIKAGETLNTWRGVASSQQKKALKGFYLEGGWEQIVFNIDRGDARADTMLYYKIKGGDRSKLGKAMTQAEFDSAMKSLNNQQQAIFREEHLALREKINHPSISGPFETGWGYDDFDGAGLAGKIGLPELPGQLTTLQK